jgi:hypothetical protein
MLAARQRWIIVGATTLAALGLASAAHAGKCNTCSTSTPPPTTTPDCGCTGTGSSGGVGGNGHHGHGGGGGEGGGSGVGSGSGSGSSSSASSSYSSGTATETAYATVFASGLTSTTSLSNIATSTTSSAGVNSSGTVYNGGGGGSFYVEQGSNGVIPNLQVEGVETAQTKQICEQFQSVAKMVAIEASCLDDKDVPHPASQVDPDRDVVGSYEGEVYRCIAGARMQYTIGSFVGAANFDHGQTITCGKNMALYHSASGELACRVQKPARDCNERSLLRRYGAGIKVLKIAAAQQCVSYRTEQVAGQSTPTSMGMDGGVGGVVH